MSIFSRLVHKLSSVSAHDSAFYSSRAAERQARLERYKKTWEAYLAELDDPLVIDSEANDNAKVNPARALINTSVYFLFGSELKFQVSPAAQEIYGESEVSTSEIADNTPNPDWLKDLNRAWKANRKQAFLYSMGLSGALHGDVFIKILPNSMGLNNEFPRLMLLDPANVDVEWDPNDCDRVLVYYIEYTTEDDQGEPRLFTEEIRAVQDESGRTLHWTIEAYEQPMHFQEHLGYMPRAGERHQLGETQIWPYVWAPIEHCQNMELPHMYWGMPDLDNSSVEVIESLQRSMSSLNKIVRVHASPRMYAKNVLPDQLSEINVSADNIITLPNMDADLAVLQTLQNIGPSIEFTDKLREDLYEMIQVPPIALGKFQSASTAISGVTLSILYAPVLQKTELKRISYGDMLERLNHKMLILMGHTDPDIFDGLVLVWPESMPGSAYLERQTLQQDQQMGVSQRTVLSRMGYDPDEEEKNRLEELRSVKELEQEFTPQPTGPGDEETRGGNNNPSGYGNQNGSMGGTQAAGTPKTPNSDNE